MIIHQKHITCSYIVLAVLLLAAPGLFAHATVINSNGYSLHPTAELTFDQPTSENGNAERVRGLMGSAIRVNAHRYLEINRWAYLFVQPVGSLTLWIKPEWWSSNSKLNHYFFVLTGPKYHRLFIQTTNHYVGVYAEARPKQGGAWIKEPVLRSDRWTFITVTWNRSHLSVSVNGNEARKSISNAPDWWATRPTKIQFGGQVYGKTSGATLIDEVRVYKQALTSEQIKHIYDKYLTQVPALADRIIPSWKPSPDNIATSAYRVTPVASSKVRQRSARVEQILDGNMHTRWISNAKYNPLPVWVQLSWPAPVQMNEVRIAESPFVHAKAYRLEIWKHGEWKTVKTVNNRHHGGLIRADLNGVISRKIRFIVTALQGHPTLPRYALSEFAVLGKATRLHRVSRPNWQAHFIWTDTPQDSNVIRYFARQFTLHHLATIKQAILQVAADDGYDAYLNGHLVGSGGIVTHTFKVKKLLNAGKNILSLGGHEAGGAQGVITQLTLIHKDGSVRTIGTNSQWKESLTKPDHWPNVNLKTSRWKPVFDEGRPPHSILHPDVAFTSPVPEDNIQLSHWQLGSNTLKPGQSTPLTFTLTPDHHLRENYKFVVSVGPKTVNRHVANFTIAHYSVTPQVPTSRWKPGHSHRLSLQLYIPPWAPQGDAAIHIQGVSPQRLIAVKYDHSLKMPKVMVQRFEHAPTKNERIPSVKIVKSDGVMQLKINGEVIPPIIMAAPASFRTSRTDGAYASLHYPIWRIWMRDDNFYTVPSGETWRQYMNKLLAGWDQRIKQALQTDPHIYILIGFSFRPRHLWVKAHPNQATILSNGVHIRNSFASPLWMKQSKRAIQFIVNHVMHASYRGHVIGFNFGVGSGPETYYWGRLANKWNTPRSKWVLGDWSPVYIQSFRKWLRKEYRGNVEAFRHAWNNPKLTFQSAYPNIKVLRQKGFFAFRNPVKSRMYYDYWHHHADIMANSVVELSKAFHKASHGKYIVGFFGLYSAGQNVAGWAPGQAQHAAYAGLQKALESPYVDFMVGLQSYINVGWNTPMTVVNLTGSITSHNKLWVTELDTRPFFSPLNFGNQTWSVDETRAVLRRDVAVNAVHNWGLWFNGFATGTTGRKSVPWFGQTSLRPLMRRFAHIYRKVAKHPSPSTAQTAVFMNDADVYALGPKRALDVLTNAQTNTWHFQMPKVAASYDLYNLPDVSLPKMNKYKLYIFLDAYNITSKERKRIKELARQKGKTVLWLYLPGYVDLQRGLSAKGVEDLTGFHVKIHATDGMPTIKLTNPSGQLAQWLPKGFTLKPHRYKWAPKGRKYRIGPLVSIDDPHAKILATYEKQGWPALAVKKVGQGRSIFMALPYFDATFLRAVCRYAGVHLYTQKIDGSVYVDASKHWMSVQTTSKLFDGHISLLEPKAVFDVFRKKLIAPKPVAGFDLHLPAHTTVLLFLGKKKTVQSMALEMALPDSTTSGLRSVQH